MSIKIVSDAYIPFVEDVFSKECSLHLVPGHEIDSSVIEHADALLVRSETAVDEELLKGSTVQFVGSATAGYDHVDWVYLDKRRIEWAYAPGCNAESVIEYVFAAIFYLSQLKNTPILNSTLGIVGVGEIGSRLEKRASALGLNVLENDPPRARNEPTRDGKKEYVKLEQLLEESDIVSLHLPLTKEGLDPTENLIGSNELGLLKDGTWILNTSRGGVVNESALIDSIRNHHIGAAAVDVWDGEPNPDPSLQELVDICSPHIAGYSRDAKRNCTQMIADRLKRHFSVPNQEVARPERTPIRLNMPEINPENNPEAFIHGIVEQMYRIEDDLDRMRSLPLHDSRKREAAFRQQRREYRSRLTFSRYELSSRGLSEEWQTRLRDGLKISMID